MHSTVHSYTGILWRELVGIVSVHNIVWHRYFSLLWTVMISLFVVLFYSIHVPNWDDGRSFSGCYFTSRHNKMNWRNALEYNDKIKLKSFNYHMKTDDDNDEDDSWQSHGESATQTESELDIDEHFLLWKCFVCTSLMTTFTISKMLTVHHIQLLAFPFWLQPFTDTFFSDFKCTWLK